MTSTAVHSPSRVARKRSAGVRRTMAETVAASSARLKAVSSSYRRRSVTPGGYASRTGRRSAGSELRLFRDQDREARERRVRPDAETRLSAQRVELGARVHAVAPGQLEPLRERGEAGRHGTERLVRLGIGLVDDDEAATGDQAARDGAERLGLHRRRDLVHDEE